MANNQEINDEYEGNAADSSKQKQLLHTGITGKVKWFNVKRGYGFVCRNDNQEDIFIHQSAIVKSNPDHPRKSVGEGEEILFDIVKGAKGNEAANVSAIDGKCVKGSEYALRYPRGRGRGRGVFRGRGRSRVVSEEGDMHTQEFARGRGRPFRGGRPYVVQYRKPNYNYDMPQQYFYEFDYYRGPPRGPRGGFRGRSFRGGSPREVPMKYEQFDNEMFDRRPFGRGRPRGRGRGRSRGRGRGRGSPRDNPKANEKEEQHQSDQPLQD